LQWGFYSTRDELSLFLFQFSQDHSRLMSLNDALERGLPLHHSGVCLIPGARLSLLSVSTIRNTRHCNQACANSDFASERLLWGGGRGLDTFSCGIKPSEGCDSSNNSRLSRSEITHTHTHTHTHRDRDRETERIRQTPE